MRVRGTGPLPPAWSGGLAALQTLVVGSNQLTGTLPVSWGAAAALPALTTLSAGDNAITGVPLPLPLPEAHLRCRRNTRCQH